MVVPGGSVTGIGGRLRAGRRYRCHSSSFVGPDRDTAAPNGTFRRLSSGDDSDPADLRVRQRLTVRACRDQLDVVGVPGCQSAPVPDGDTGKSDVGRAIQAESVPEGPGQHVVDARTVLPADLGIVVADRDDVTVVE